jgi:glycosyltransferase involved in cell wall biosynthesis
MKKKLSVIIPVYNEEKNISRIISELNKSLLDTAFDYELIFINDGSHDNTLNEIKFQTTKVSNIFFIDFSKKFGKECALKAGIDASNSDATITIDTDVQYPNELLAEMIFYWIQGYDIVRVKNEVDLAFNKFAKTTSSWFSRSIFFRDGYLEDNLSAFILLDAKVILELKRICEDDMFLKEMIGFVGFSQIAIPFRFKKKYLDSRKYYADITSKGRIKSIAAIGMGSLYVVMSMGLLFSSLALLYIFYMFMKCIFGHVKFTGWGSLIATTVFFGGVQLFVLGIIGLYVSKIFLQTKKRPNYIIQSTNL